MIPEVTLLSTGFWWSIRYNLGSLAFGSFILAVVWIIRIVFEYIDSQLEGAKKENKVVQIISNVLRCYLDCFHRFIKFLNQNAYIQIALTGDNFCSSAMSAFVLALKNAATFFITNGIGSLIQFLGKITISLLNVFLCYLIIMYSPEFEDDDGEGSIIDNPIPVLGVMFVISFTLATIFMEVYSCTSLAILQCLYADVDICNQ
jgi:choline transporter-like protein 2/4/5